MSLSVSSPLAGVEEEARVIIRGTVEEHWKTVLEFAGSGSAELGKECILRFDRHVAEAASRMSDEEAGLYSRLMEEERERIFDEYTRNPSGLKERLGVVASVTHAVPSVSRTTHLADTAVNTAVRATIWEGIRAWFR